MTYILQEKFGGIAPRIERTKLNPEMAATATDVDTTDGTLRGLRTAAPTSFQPHSSVKTIYPYGGSWLEWNEYVSVAANPISNDVHGRLFYTDAFYPKVKVGAATYRLGLPRAATPTVTPPTLPVGANDPESLLEIEDIYYVVTLVDVLGTEGPPSAASAVVRRVRDQTVEVTFGAVPSGNYNLGTGALMRVYRSNTGTDNTVFQYVGEKGIFEAGFTDSVPNSQLQEVLPSSTWVGPPDDNASIWPDGPLQGLCLGPNGMMAGYSKNTIYASEPYLPHAWPNEYKTTIAGNIRGIVWIASGLLVVTDGAAVILTGSHPASMTVFSPEKSWPCIADQSLVDMGGWAVYAGADGLIGVDGSTFTNLTEQLMDPRDWRNSAPAAAVGGNSEGRYVLFSTAGIWGNTSIMFDPKGGRDALIRIPSYHSLVAYTDVNSRLVIKNGSYLSYFEGGTTREPYIWESKVYTLSGDTNFAYLEVHADFSDGKELLVTINRSKLGEPYAPRSFLDTTYPDRDVYTVTSPITALRDNTAWDRYAIHCTTYGLTNPVTSVSAIILHEDLSELG